MPLPAGGPKEAWPPPKMKRVFEDMGKWAAWYSSDPEALSRVYGGDTGAQVHNRPAQFMGGVVGAVARMWWGQPTPAGQPRVKLHVPLAADIAAKSADLLYSEPPSFTFDDGNTAAQDRVNQLIEEGLYATLLESADAAAALSGVYLRVVWDKAFNPDGAWIDVVHADCAVPEWRWGQLFAVTFWHVVARNDDDVVRHLQHYSRGKIEHAVYMGDDDTLGERQLNHPVLTDLAAAASTDTNTVEVLDGVVTITVPGDALAAEYVPNIRPARQWRTVPAAAGMGRSDYAGVEGLLDQLDEAWSSWMRDLRLGKARLMVPDGHLRNLGPGQGAQWNADQEIFTAMKIMPSADKSQIESSQFAIRVAEHEGTVRALMQQIVTSAGYSGQSFGLSGDVAITATEVSARERQSYITRDRKITYQRPPVTRIIETLLAIEKEHFNAAAEPARPKMDFADGVSDSTETIARTLQLIEAARAASVKTKVTMLHPEWDDKQINAEVKLILEEQGIGKVEDPATFTGGPPPPGDEDPLAEDATEVPDAEPEDAPPADKA